MKTQTILFALVFTIKIGIAQTAEVVNIPDAQFKSHLINNSTINTNNDDEIQLTEASTFSGNINCSLLAISDLTGIEAFVNLLELNCSSNDLTSLNISGLAKLKALNCSKNDITNLNLNGCTQLNRLICGENKLEALDVTSNTGLVSIMATTNRIQTIDVTNINGLNYLWVNENQLTSLDVTKNSELRILSCGSNKLEELDVSQNQKLSTLACSANENLSVLNVSNNPKLGALSCSGSNLSELDLSSNPELRLLYCNNNKIMRLDLSANPILKEVYCSNNDLHSLLLNNGNTENMQQVKGYNNPNLSCVQVDNVAAVENKTGWDFDSTVQFSEHCATASMDDVHYSKSVLIYPNPAFDLVKIFVVNNNFKECSIYNVLGEHIFTSKNALISLSNMATGVYFLRIKSLDNKTATKRIVKVDY